MSVCSERVLILKGTNLLTRCFIEKQHGFRKKPSKTGQPVILLKTIVMLLTLGYSQFI